MNNPAEQIIAANKANLDAFEGAAKKAYAGVEKLVELNLAASKPPKRVLQPRQGRHVREDPRNS
jgi:hypothetical protein